MKRIISLALVIFTLLSCLALPISSAVAPIIDPMESTYVVDDLEKMGYKVANYPKDPSAEHLQIIHFLEYGYGGAANLGQYGLYLYIYNPSGREIAIEGSYLQLSYLQGATNTDSSYAKYPLKVLSYSIDQDDSHVFYKLEVMGASRIGQKISQGSRTYNLANAEILYKGESKPVTMSWESGKGVTKNRWIYTGRQYNFGSSEPLGTLAYECDYFETIQVEMHDASWMSDTSSLGKEYRWEVKSYYFNIPTSYILKYGNPTLSSNDTDGLVSVQGEYYKYGVNGLVVPDAEWYERFDLCDKLLLGSSTVESLPSFGYFKGRSSTTNTSRDFYYFTYNKNLDSFTKSNFELSKFLLLSQRASPLIDSNSLIALWEAADKPVLASSSQMYMGEYVTGLGSRVDFEVNVNGKDLSSALTTYASTKKDGIGKWLDKVFNNELYTDEDGYLNCKPLIQINANDVSEAYMDSANGKRLYLDQDSYIGLQEFYNDHFLNSNVYLMRLAVEPFFETEVDLLTSPSAYNKSGTGYYYEKVVHKNADIFSFTFETKDGKRQIVPVDCDPVDNLGGVTGNPSGNSNPNGYPDEPSIYDLIKGFFGDVEENILSLKSIVILAGIALGSVAMITIIVSFWEYLEPLFIRIGALLGRVSSWVFRILGTVLKALWNIGFTVIFYFTGLDLRIRGGLDLSGGSTKAYTPPERRKKEKPAAPKATEPVKPGKSYDADDFFEAAVERTYRELK